MNAQLWNAVIVAIDNDLQEYKDMGTNGHPELDIRYGKMLQARGYILIKMEEDKDAKV
jgi:hypothetical protein